jgi:hypothetical protein
VTWILDESHTDCPRCKLQVRDGFVDIDCEGIENVSKCPRGIMPKLSNSNALFWTFYRKISISLFNGMGGFSLAPIPDLLKVYNVPNGQHSIFYDRLFIVLGEINAKKAKT